MCANLNFTDKFSARYRKKRRFRKSEYYPKPKTPRSWMPGIYWSISSGGRDFTPRSYPR